MSRKRSDLERYLREKWYQLKHFNPLYLKRPLGKGPGGEKDIERLKMF